MSDLHIKLIYEQQKTERLTANIEQYGNDMRDLQKALKVGRSLLARYIVD